MNNASPANSSTSAIVGGIASASFDDFQIPTDLLLFQHRKDEALHLLKNDLMAALNKEVKSLDEDNWRFEGPRSRINHISRPGGFLSKNIETTKNKNAVPQKGDF